MRNIFRILIYLIELDPASLALTTTPMSVTTSMLCLGLGIFLGGSSSIGLCDLDCSAEEAGCDPNTSTELALELQGWTELDLELPAATAAAVEAM